MEELWIYDVKELFSKAKCEELIMKYGFSAGTNLYAELNKYYTFYMFYSEAERPATGKDPKNAFKAISTNADKLIASLDLPVFETAGLHSSLEVDRGPYPRFFRNYLCWQLS